MYESFFRFRYRPFAILPDADSIVWTDGHRNAFSVVEMGLDRRSQVTVLTGGIGTGKTTLIRHLLQTKSSAFSAAFSVGLLSNFAGERGDLLPWVLSAFDLDISEAPDAVMFRRLQKFFATELEEGRRSVLIVDEAQNLSEQDLENLRLLSNLNDDQVLIMLVLVGQPQLRAQLDCSENQRLCQRIGADYHLEPLTGDDTARYIRHRCVRAGGAEDLFDAAALEEVHRISAGVPRKINVLCDLALISAYADGAPCVDHRVVRSVMEDARRHGTYASLSEHDVVPVADGAPAVTADARPREPAAVESPPRDPMQRLALVRESGGCAGRAGPLEAVAAAAAGPAPFATGPSAPFADDPGDLNALFDAMWPDETLLFLDDADDEETGSAAAVEHPAADFPTPHALHGAASPAVARPLAETPSAHRHQASGGIDLGQIGQALLLGAGETKARRSPRRHIAASTATAAMASPAASARTGRPHASAPRPGWRKVGWRGAAGLAALAASGSMAAGLAIALLPDGTSPRAPSSAVTEPWAEASGDQPERLSQAGAPEAAQTAAPGSTPAVQVAAETAQYRTAEGPPVASGLGATTAAFGMQVAGGAPARSDAQALQPIVDVRNPPDVESTPEPAAFPSLQPPSAMTSSAPAEPTTQALAWQESVPATPEAEAAFRHALDIALDDPAAAAIGYARAALLGHERSAYYLGQIYESGDGVPVDFAIARHWYETASAGNSRARSRLADLPPPEQGGPLAPPLALLAEPRGTGQADFVWTSGPGADPTSYVVELSGDPGEGAATAYSVVGSAARLPLVAGASHWRVLALDATGGRGAASDWQQLMPESEKSAAAAAPADRL